MSDHTIVIIWVMKIFFVLLRSRVRARLRYSGVGGPPSPPQTVANLCIRAPHFPGSPVWRWLWGALGLEKLLEPALRLSVFTTGSLPLMKRGALCRPSS